MIPQLTDKIGDWDGKSTEIGQKNQKGSASKKRSEKVNKGRGESLRFESINNEYLKTIQ